MCSPSLTKKKSLTNLTTGHHCGKTKEDQGELFRDAFCVLNLAISRSKSGILQLSECVNLSHGHVLFKLIVSLTNQILETSKAANSDPFCVLIDSTSCLGIGKASY
jgi:hypothetical protein